MTVDREHQSDADVQHQHRTAAGGVEGQRDADDRQQAQVHAHVHRDLSHQGTADAGADVAAQQIFAAGTGGKGLDHQREQHAQHHAAAHKTGRIADPAQDKVVVGIWYTVVPVAEQPVAEDAAGADGDLSALLLIDDVLPHRFAGGPAGGVLRVNNGQDAVPLVALADLVAEKGEGRRYRCTGCCGGTQDILPAQACGKHHAAADDAVDDGCAVVALHMDDGNGHQQVQQQLGQFLWLIDVAAHIVQMHGKGEDEADLGQLCGLEGKAAQLVPGVVVGITGVVADGERADRNVSDEQGGQNQAPGQHHMHRPHLDKAAVVDAGQQQSNDQTDAGRTGLHQRTAVVADAGDLAGDRVGGKPVALFGGPGRQCQHRHGAAEDAQQQVDLVSPFPILSNAFQ